MSSAKSILLLATVLALPARSQQDGPQELESKLSGLLTTYSSVRGGVLDNVLAIAKHFRLPMGIEWIAASETPIAARSWSDATALAILQDIVKSSPGYSLEISNGVVHILPAWLKDDPADILNAHIGTFEVSNQYPPGIVASILPQRLRTIMVRPIPPGPNWQLAGSTLMSGNESRVTFRLENPTVREILDRLCQSASRNIWIVRYPAVPTKTNAGYLKMLRNDERAVRDDQEFFPSFDLLAWGMPVLWH